MKPASTSFRPNLDRASHIAEVNLDEVDAVQLARALQRCPSQPRPTLIIDCHNPRCQRTLGVSYLVSQLLGLHRTGANIRLLRVNAPLRHCLELLQLDQVFSLHPAEEPTHPWSSLRGA